MISGKNCPVGVGIEPGSGGHGGVSRSALERMAVGSTAEFVLDRLASDVLVIK